MLATVLQQGDWVTTDTGQVGRIVHINRLTLFVAIPTPDGNDRIDGYLESQLTLSDQAEVRPL